MIDKSFGFRGLQIGAEGDAARSPFGYEYPSNRKQWWYTENRSRVGLSGRRSMTFTAEIPNLGPPNGALWMAQGVLNFILREEFNIYSNEQEDESSHQTKKKLCVPSNSLSNR
jgi:hypothetical protein